MSTSSVPRRLGRPSNVASSETRERLLVAARQIFASHGYDATTNRQIAEAVGITTGAIYHYVESKADLYAEVYESVQDEVFDAFEQAIAGETTLLARFSAVLDTAVALNARDNSLASFVAGVQTETHRHPELVEKLRGQRFRRQNFLRRLVRDAASAGELADGVEPQALEDLLTCVLAGLASFSVVSEHRERHRAAVEVLKRFLAGQMLDGQHPQAGLPPVSANGDAPGPKASHHESAVSDIPSPT